MPLLKASAATRPLRRILERRAEDGDQQEVILAMCRIAEAFGVREVAESASLNAKTLYRTLSPAGNPQLSSLRAILAAVGLRLAVMPIAAN